MPVRFLLVAAAVVLTACSDGDDARVSAQASAGPSAAATTDQAVAAPGTREAVYAAQPEGPEPFVRALYAQYVAGGPKGEPPEPGREPLFSRTLNALVGADFRAANGEVPTLDHDPLCACQDQGDFVVTALAVAQSAPNAAEANVAFTNLGEAKTLKLKLVREGINWKVDDIIDGETSVHDELMKVAEAAG